MVEPSGPTTPVPPLSSPTGRPVAPSSISRSTSAGDLAGLSGDWPAQAADLIVDKVDLVKSKTTGPILTAARGAVFGLIALVLGTMALILLLIGVVRGLDAIIPSSVWSTYLVLGALFTLVGTLLFRRRRTPGLSDPTSR